MDGQSRSVNQFWVNYTRQNGGRIPVPGNSTLADFGSDFGVVGTPSRRTSYRWRRTGFTLSQAITGPKAGTNLLRHSRCVEHHARQAHTLLWW